MNSGIPVSGRPDESLERLFGSVFDLAGQFTTQISQDEIQARLHRTLREAQRRETARQAAPSSAAGQPVSALVDLASTGDGEAWNQIVDRYAPLVYSICRRYRLTGHDTEDVGQRVWLLLIERIGQLREPAALPGWLATTTQRECLRVVTAAQKSGRLGTKLDQALRFVGDTALADEILIAERNAAVRAAFVDLPDRCQRLLSMLYSDPPHSYAEISAALGIPVGSIGPQRARCLNRLRRAMTPGRLGDEADGR